MSNGKIKHKKYKLTGNERWTLGGKTHREDGPAFIIHGIGEWWYQDGKKHRADGPAFISLNGMGKDEWWYKGVHYESFDEWLEANDADENTKLKALLKYKK
jgi:hypothetical protein